MLESLAARTLVIVPTYNEAVAEWSELVACGANRVVGTE